MYWQANKCELGWVEGVHSAGLNPITKQGGDHNTRVYLT